MEAVRDFIAVEDSGRGIAPAGPSGVAGVQGVDTALALLREAASTAAGDAALWNFREAAHFAGTGGPERPFQRPFRSAGIGRRERPMRSATAGSVPLCPYRYVRTRGRPNWVRTPGE